VIWSLLLHLAPLVRTGLVNVWAVDPKGGMELAAGRSLFARFCHGDSDTAAGYEPTFAEVLEDAVAGMRRRQDRLRGVTRLHQPSTAEPLVVLVVEELAALTGWVTDRTAKKRIEAALGLLLSQGRAVGVVVVWAVQDPRKEVLPMRDLFPTRIALRLNEAEQVGLVLGPGARNRGAHADLIPDSLPGVGYVTVDGIAEPGRVRFSYVTDNHILQLTSPAGRRPCSWSTAVPREYAVAARRPGDHSGHGARAPPVAEGVHPAAAPLRSRPPGRDGGGGRAALRVDPRGGALAVRAQGEAAADAAVPGGLAPHRRTRTPAHATARRPGPGWRGGPGRRRDRAAGEVDETAAGRSRPAPGGAGGPDRRPGVRYPGRP